MAAAPLAAEAIAARFGGRLEWVGHCSYLVFRTARSRDDAAEALRAAGFTNARKAGRTEIELL